MPFLCHLEVSDRLAASAAKPRRGCATRPRVGTRCQPWVEMMHPRQPRTGLWPAFASHNAVGVGPQTRVFTQGSPFGPTLGFAPQPPCG